MPKKQTNKTEKPKQLTEWEELLAWGAKPENQKQFEVLERHWVLGQRLPVAADEAAKYGGVPEYLLYCEGMANAARELKALKTRYDKLQADRSKKNG